MELKCEATEKKNGQSSLLEKRMYFNQARTCESPFFCFLAVAFCIGQIGLLVICSLVLTKEHVGVFLNCAVEEYGF
jgi:hypothetical protein